MNISLESGGALKISGPLTIPSAEALREVLLQHCVSWPCPEIDLGLVETTDLAALQVILAAQSQARLLKKELRITGISSSVAGAAQALGISLQVFEHPGRQESLIAAS